MNSDLKENKVEEINIKKIKEILSSDRAVNAGVVFISEAQKKVILGAMNPIYSKVLEIVDEIKEKFSFEVEVKQITTEEWEKWNTEEIQQPKTNELNNSNKVFNNFLPEEKFENNEFKEAIKLKDKEIDDTSLQNSDKKPKSLLQEIISNELSNNLKDKQDDKFDFFELDENPEEDEELDIIEDSELEDADDPVIKAAGSILSTFHG